MRDHLDSTSTLMKSPTIIFFASLHDETVESRLKARDERKYLLLCTTLLLYESAFNAS